VERWGLVVSGRRRMDRWGVAVWVFQEEEKEGWSDE
jgi:hypothetical protein